MFRNLFYKKSMYLQHNAFFYSGTEIISIHCVHGPCQCQINVGAINNMSTCK